MATREYDIVLFGATGFVGKLTAAHLAQHAPAGARIALAGRSESKLQSVRASLPAAAHEWPLLVADAGDATAMADLAARTTVVATTVGPYVKYGNQLVAACAAAGTHYADLTGEVLFVKRSIDGHHRIAKESGARIIHSCGFDSIPSDLGVFLTAETAKADGSGPLGRTRLAVRRLRGGFSGGTIDSARVQAMEASDAGVRAQLADPWLLAEGGRPSKAPTSSSPSSSPGILDRLTSLNPVRRDPDNGNYTGPFVMAAFNTRIVARSASLLDYGSGFRYVEYLDTGSGPKGALTSAATAAVLTAGLLGLSFAPTRLLLDRVLPKPGEGPSEEDMAKGRFVMEINTTAGPGDDGRTTAYRTKVAAPYDPGYSGTAIMLGQSALALAFDELGGGGGVLTPATGIGMPLIERLRAHTFTFETTRTPVS